MHSRMSAKSLISVCLFLAELVSVFALAPQTFRHGQFYPTKGTSNPTTSQALASGPIRDVIRRNSARFRKVLVRNVNGEVEFYTDDSRYMTSRAKSKLDVLASQVVSTWGGSYRVRVLKAWTDTVDRYDLLSLHYEGRALQIQMSDRDPGKLGRLAGLAAESGFDWVYFANAAYVIISVIPDVCQTKLDLALVIDTSGSVTMPNFLKVREFVKKVVDFFNIGRDETHVALISYSYGVTREFPLNQYYDKFSMKRAIHNMRYEGGSTATGDALYVMRTWAFSTANGARTDKTIPKIGILLTDGRSNTGRSVYYSAREVQAAGISMFVVGVGGNLGIGEINAVASDPDNTHVFRLDTFYDLNGFVDQLSTVSCDEGAAVSQCDSAETSVEGGSFKYFKGQFESATRKVTIEVQDMIGKNFLYLSLTNKNPGPLDPGSEKATGDRSPRAITVDLTRTSTKIVYMAVQGQFDQNKFLISIWDSLFDRDIYQAEVVENDLSRNSIITVKSFQVGYAFRYSIAHGNDRNSFSIDQNTGEISSTRSFDREVQSFYSLIVVAQDVNLQCHKGRTQVDIKIKDKNDNKPVFEQSPYRTDIREDTPLNQLVQTVSAKDKDEGINAQIQYFIESGPSARFFRMNSQSGQIFLATQLDYETDRTHTVKLKAVDGGNPAQSATTDFIVNVLDVNEAPRFTTPCAQPGTGGCKVSLMENRPANTPVTKLDASDPDGSQTCPLQFSIQSSDAAYFKIDKSTGQITTSRPLDREVKDLYLLSVYVTDCGRLSAQTDVYVTALDENDNKPVFSANQYTSVVPENLPGNTDVIKLVATDSDAGKNAEIRYSITGGNTDSGFQIEPTSGMVSTAKPLDRESVETYTLTVTATDQGSPALQSSVKLTITVLDVNDNSPVFGGATAFKIAENVVKGTQVGQVTVTDADKDLNGQIRCSITKGNIGYAFSINPSNCLISSFGSIDREARSSYSLEIEAADLGQPSRSARQTYTVIVTDVNDNAPTFSSASYSLLVNENAAVNTDVETVSATDDDEGINAEIVYTVESGDDPTPKFKISGDKGTITLVGTLDFGKRNSYELKVKAEDKGTPTLQNFVTVTIKVKDTNDFKPVFGKDKYQKSIPENTGVDKDVIKVAATDKDSGPSGFIFYSITSGNIGSAFVINSGSGMIKTKNALDYETIKSYSLIVTATDLGNPPQSSTATVQIDIIDVNDNSPKLTQNPATFTVSESENAGHEVGTITATDKDDGVNKELIFSTSTTRVPFQVQPDGKIKVTGALDYETTKQYMLDVKVVDKGVPQLHDTGKVIINVQDANDNAPVFEAITCDIMENSRIGSHVCYIKATDDDSGVNSVVTYKLEGTGPFKIDPKSGDVTTTGDLDREAKDSYDAKVIATDGGTPVKSSEKVFQIKIKDENDNAPVFTQKQYSMTVTEEQAKTVAIGTVKATDADTGVNAQLTYSIIRGNTGKSFTINPSSGEITAKEKLDRETIDTYDLLVRVEDGGSPSLSAEVTVIVKVQDINDNDPVFSSNPYKSKIREDAAPGTKVIQVSATDADIGTNGEIIYSISAGTFKERFDIDDKNGVITTKVALDYETDPKYDLTVTATDKGTPSRSSTSKVSIELINVDDNAPEFGKISEAQVSEGVSIGTPVVKFNAKDKDGGILTYSITGGNSEDAFQVDSKNGELTVKKRLDRETTPSYKITVTVTDASGHTTAADLPIKILDVNDNNPIFEKDKYSGSVKENSGSGVAVLTVKATDKDIGVNQEIEYLIDSGNKDDAFTLDPISGELKTKRALDREVNAFYSLKIRAVDKGSPALSSVVPADIKIIDENDNSPKFEKDAYKEEIAENGNAGTTVLIVQANDIDEGANGEVSYKLLNENAGAVPPFSIDNKKGVIVTTQVLDREKQGSYKLTVEAADGGTPSRKSKVTVDVTVKDENDNIPQIVSPSKIDPLPENTAAKTEIATIKATDEDIGPNGMFTFRIVSGNTKNAFSLTSDGKLSTATALDREDVDSYTLRIEVKDQGASPLQSHKDYKIDIKDVNDNCPQFSSQKFEGTVDENSKTGTPVMQLKATDADIGENAKLTYSIKKSANSDHFSCNPTTGAITTAKVLDYEDIKEYDLECEVTDGNCKDDVPCTVKVGNVNDNSPVFEKNPYTEHVKENVGIGTLVLTVKATDKDPFGEIRYKINSTVAQFSINSLTGEIKTKVTLDREAMDKYEITVTATDGGQPAKSAQAKVLIMVDDVNDNAPKFKKDGETVTVQENKKPGDDILTTLLATDADAGPNKEILYEIVKSVDSSYFAVDSKTGKVTTAVSFDRELKSTYTVKFEAKDQGKPQLTSKPFVLVVNIGDENDNKPTFAKSYKVSVSEGDAVGSNVLVVVANDQDVGVNAEIAYSLSAGNDKGHFAVDGTSGVITVNKKLDREAVPSYTLTVTAADNGKPSLSGTTTVEVTVTDINDNAPVFDPKTLTASVKENQKKDTVVGTVKASDRDIGENAKISFILGSNDKFNVNPDTGVVTTIRPLDREEQSSYRIKITAKDHGNPPLSTTETLVIGIEDEDDNCPVFNPKVYRVTIPEKIARGTGILNVTATDRDIGANAVLDYAVKEGDDRGAFRVDKTTGEVQVYGEVDREYLSVYHLRIRAGNPDCGVVDNNDTNVGEGGKQRQKNDSLADVYITVTDVNDNAPRFGSAGYHYNFKNSQMVNLLNITAVDLDTGDGGKVKFRLKDVRGFKSAGKEGRYVIVEAYDLGSPSLSANATVTINNEIQCGAMSFSISETGSLSVTTLCGFSELPKPLNVEVGQTLTLNCKADGNSVPRYNWLRNGNIISSASTSGTLKIDKVEQDSEGGYSCVSYNAAGNIQSQSVEVQVLERPRIVNQPEDTSVAVGSDAVLSFKATGDPTPDYQWYKGGRPFYEGKGAKTHTLTLERAIVQDEGEYSCLVTNSVGKITTRTLSLKVFEKETVVTLTLNVTKPNEKGTCNYFIPENFEKELTQILGNKVSVTDIRKAGTCNITACSPNPCKNKGRCEVADDSYQCICPPGWTGTNCELDRNECKTVPPICQQGGKCTNMVGSYKCACKTGLTGRNCELKADSCQSDPCNSTQLCVLTSNNPPATRTCIPKGQEFELVLEVGKDGSDTYKLEEMLNRLLKTLGQKRTSRRRRDTTTKDEDFSACNVRVVNDEPDGNGKVKVRFVLVCPKDLQNKVTEKDNYFCNGILTNAEGAKSCGLQGKPPSTPPPKIEPPPTKVQVQVVVRENKTGKALSASETKDLIEEKDAKTKLKGSGIELEGSSNAFDKRTGATSKSKAGLIIGICLGLVALAVVAVIVVVVVLKRRKDTQQSQAFMISDRAEDRRQSKEDLLRADISMNAMDSPGVQNKGYANGARDSYAPSQETFMFKMPDKVTKSSKGTGIESLSWYRGVFTEQEAEKYFEHCKVPGSYILYKTSDGRIILAVKAPEGGPPVRHIPITKSSAGQFVAKVGSMAPVSGETMDTITEHFRVTPMSFGDTSPDVVLTEPWQKTAL